MSGLTISLGTCPDETRRDEASRFGRAAIEAALERYTGEQRDAFWNAIGLYYSTRRHPGAGEAKPEAPLIAAVA